MSILLMTEAWKSDLPTGQKMVLLALCDSANDVGECYPSVPTLSKKCSMSERAVQGHLSAIEKMGIVAREMRTGRSTLYKIDRCKICAPEDLAPPQSLRLTPAEFAKTPADLSPSPAESAPITTTQPSEPLTKPNTPAFSLPDWVPVDVWDEFMATRKKLKAKDTDYAKKLLVNQLSKFKDQGHDPVEIINTSIRSGWKDVYAPRVSASQATKRTGFHHDLSKMDYTKGVDDHGNF